jgi:hypothetical protein
MKTLNSRVLRLALVTLATLAAGAVHAGTPQPTYNSGSGNVCISPFTVTNSFSLTSFTGAAKCESLCKQAFGYCKGFVKDAVSCLQRDNGNYWSLFDNNTCDTQSTPADKKDCKSFVKGDKDNAKLMYDSWRDEALSDCAGMQDTCIANCNPPL